MSATQTLLENNDYYAATFDKGHLPLPRLAGARAPVLTRILAPPGASGLLLALLLKPRGTQRFERTPAGTTTP